MLSGVGCVCFPASSDVYCLKKSQHNIKIQVNGVVEEASIVAYVYTEVPLNEQRYLVRDQHIFPGKTQSAKQHNRSYQLAVESFQRDWVGKSTPNYVVLVREQPLSGAKRKHINIIFRNATIYRWPLNILTVQGDPTNWSYQIVGALTGEVKGGVYQTDETVTVHVEDRSYTGDPFQVSADGHYIGNDGYEVPKNFPEFFDKNPNYVRRWASKWLKLPESDDAVRDWEQDLLLYLHYLPEVSKSRRPSEHHPEGCTDVIQCFDPYRQYGASERRFRNYVNICLSNRSITMIHRQEKNPVYKKDNLAFNGMQEEDSVVTVDDEYLHSHSKALESRAEHEAANVEKRLLVKRFMEYVLDNEPELCDTVIAISETGTLREAQEVLEMDEQTFNRNRKRIIQLKDAFMDGGPVQKQRKPYRKRIKLQGALLPVGVTNGETAHEDDEADSIG